MKKIIEMTMKKWMKKTKIKIKTAKIVMRLNDLCLIYLFTSIILMSFMFFHELIGNFENSQIQEKINGVRKEDLKNGLKLLSFESRWRKLY